MTTPAHARTTTLTRRTLLRGLLAGGAVMTAGTAIGACSASPAPPRPTEIESGPSMSTSSARTVLLAYFSRPGENYYNGGRRDLEVGNTEVLARMIADRIRCDVHRIQAADPYPNGYDATVRRNVREQEADARPAIAGPLNSIDRYDTILLGSPIWNVRAPMVMSTFTEALDFRGKTVAPFTTHAMSGLGATERDYAASCPGATLAEGLAVRGEEVEDADAAVEAWLRRLGLPAAS
ncbi:flavodoxin [Streptomyces sp. NPDC002812]|uniref:flavodoxin n=1 Tax=Streptomyces sp. NPDC002812 TaxID=3154434 RepID=UPI0033168307